MTVNSLDTLVKPAVGGTCVVDPPQGAAAPLDVIDESDETNNTCDDTVTVIAPDLSLDKTDGVTEVIAGGTTTYSLTVTNGGTAPTSGTITVVDVLPAGMSVADAESPGAGFGRYGLGLHRRE